MNKAHELYSAMLINYKKWKAHGINVNASHNRFLNAAEELAKLQLPNPFPIGEEPQMNAQTVPERDNIPVTAVKE